MKQKNVFCLLFFFLLLGQAKYALSASAKDCISFAKTSGIISTLQALIQDQNEFAGDLEKANNGNNGETKSVFKQGEIPPQCIPPQFTGQTFTDLLLQQNFDFCVAEVEQAETKSRLAGIVSSQNLTKNVLDESTLVAESIIDYMETLTEQSAQYEAFIQCLETEAGVPLACLSGICQQFLPTQYIPGMDIFQFINKAPFDHGAGLNIASWRDNKYIAIGGFLGNPPPAAGARLRIVEFTTNPPAINTTANENNLELSATVRGVAWSPDMKYLAYHDNTTLHVHEFKSGKLTTNDFTIAIASGAPRTLSWSKNGTYICAAGFGANPNLVETFKFDPTAVGAKLTLFDTLDTNVASPFPVNEISSITWRDNTYLAIATGPLFVGFQGVRVYEFDESGAQFIFDSSFDHTANTLTASWSPNGTYLAIGGGGAAGNINIRVLEFTPGSLDLKGNSVLVGETEASLAWQDNEYFASGNSSMLRILKFDKTNLDVNSSITTEDSWPSPAAAINTNSIAWSTGRQFLAFAGNPAAVGVEELEVFSFCHYETS